MKDRFDSKRFFYTNTKIIETLMIPVSANRVVMTVHDLKVCFSVMPKYWLTSQNPLSLTCEKILAHEAMAMTKQASSTALHSVATSKGETKPAAVIMATDDEP